MTFTAKDCAKIGKYTTHNGVAVARIHFKQLKLSESTIRHFRPTLPIHSFKTTIITKGL